MAYKLRHGPIRMYGGDGDGDPEKGKGEGKTPPQPRPQVKEASLGLPPAGIQSFPTQQPTGSMAGLQPVSKKPTTGTSITPTPQKTRKKFKNTKIGKFVKKVGNIQINFPTIRLPNLGGKSSGRGCTKCSRKFQRTRGR